MRLFGSLLVIFGSLFIFSLIPEAVNFFINIGLVPDEPKFRNSVFYQFFALLAVYMELIIFGLICVCIMTIYSMYLDNSYNRSIKKAKKKAVEQYGTDLPYFLYLEEKHLPYERFNISRYPYFVIRLYEKENGIKVGETLENRQKEELSDIYEEYAKKLDLPVVRNEYISI